MAHLDNADALARRAFWVLVGALSAQALLQTARDALFLAEIPVTRLPWTYIMVAALTLLVATGQRYFRSTELSTTMLGASAGTFVIWAALPFLGSPILYILYAWTGVIGAWLGIQFWSQLSGAMTMTDARRLFSKVASGATFGAVAGHVGGTVLTTFLPANVLLPAAAGVYLGTSAMTRRLDASLRDHAPPEGDGEAPLTLREVWTPYVLGVATVILLGSMTLTTVDWYFKAEVARQFSPAELGQAFATAYLLLNITGAFVQLFVVQRVLRGPGVMVGITTLPILVLGSGSLGLFGFATASAALAKLSDGALKYTLHKTSVELLYVPMSGRVRRRVKKLIDVIGGKGGQAAASLGILSMLALELDVTWALVGVATAWLLAAVALRWPYRNIFRTTLRELVVEVPGELPSLDVQSLSALVEGLSSTDDAEVLTSLALLEHHDKANLVPALLLYHPSPRVVERALDLFSRSRSERFVPIAHRILGQASPLVHAAAVRALFHFETDPSFLLANMNKSCPATSATSTVFARERGLITETEFKERIQAFLDHGPPLGRIAIARAAELVNLPELHPILSRLVTDDSFETRRAAFAALATKQDPQDVELFLSALQQRPLRKTAKDALKGMGPTICPALLDALKDPRWTSIHWILPELISHLPPDLAVPALTKALTDPADGLVEYHLIRALEWIRLNRPDAPLPSVPLEAAFQKVMRSVQGLAHASATVLTIHGEDPGERRAMLRLLLKSKRAHAAERALRILSLYVPSESIHLVLRGLLGPHPLARASALELLDGWVPLPHNQTLRAHFSGATPAEICEAAGRPFSSDVETVYRELASSRSSSLRLLATSLLEQR